MAITMINQCKQVALGKLHASSLPLDNDIDDNNQVG